MTKKPMFDFVIGNPPYQDTTIGANGSFAPPIYHLFIDAGAKIGETSIMIHPARFLFNAGGTPVAWNKKVLQDEHFSVLQYNPQSAEIFPSTDIKGGVAVTAYQQIKRQTPIGQFVPFPELRNILHKVEAKHEISLASIIYAAESYKFTEQLHVEHKQAETKLSKGHKYDLKSNVFDTLHNIAFFEEQPNTSVACVQIYGIVNGNRVYRYIPKNYIRGPENFEKYKVLLPNANGSGALGEVFSTPLIGTPLIGHTQTFLSIGNFDHIDEAEACMKYIKGKFARAMLGIMKVTQSNARPMWKHVPLQNFTAASDIDWSQSIAEIDQQLYAKYGLSPDEIDFIESHVKEME
jgi:hypothetical protein